MLVGIYRVGGYLKSTMLKDRPISAMLEGI